MAGKISALCLMGAVKVVSASIFSPSATATEPILLEVSTANTKGFRAIILVLNNYILRFSSRALLRPQKKHFLDDYFCPSLPRLSSLVDNNLNIIGRGA